jgi:hypothetical protein
LIRWVDRRDPIGIETVKSFRDSIADDDDSTFSAPAPARWGVPQRNAMHATQAKSKTTYHHLETFKLIKASRES